MKKIYTCYVCGFAWAIEEEKCPDNCPGCAASPDHFLSEPWRGDMKKRRIHVDPPEPDPNRDVYDISYHGAKNFIPQRGDGRVRKFVLGYDKGQAEEIKSYYRDAYGWDIIEAEHSADPENPVMYCATGPGTPDWEPRIPSFIYGFLIPRDENHILPDPSYIIEVKDIEATCKKVAAFGGKVLKERFTFEGQDYAVIEDSEGNGLYIWEVKEDPEYCL